ncbi:MULTISPECIES: primosomal replication protein [unclassified Pseudoalteromonas]|uniref:primosomal replication protein n=1 Tax=unclassified Pseudoalteromonas TaxID=194690 RepID=UPI000CF63BCE|nr:MULTISPECIES: primosomal replication protein [unclassified Pseudoalteromonas]
MARADALTRLKQQVQRLRHDAEQFDKAKWFAKNRYMQNQHALFERSVFNTRSMQLLDYVDEVEQQLERLGRSELQAARHQYTFALTQLSEQIEAIVKVLKATPVWEKENTPSSRARKYQKAVQQLIQPTSELYQELAKNHEFERRLELMISERRQLLHKAQGEQATQLNKEILALHARLGRCRKAIGACEERIQYAEKQQAR